MAHSNKFLIGIALLSFFSLTACKKVAKDVAENVTEKTIAKEITKETAEDYIEKIGKKELKTLKWVDLYTALTKEKPSLTRAIDNLDESVRGAFQKIINKDLRFVKALTTSNTIIDECQVYSKDAPRLMKDANFVRMYVKSDIARKEGRTCIIDNLIAKEEKGFVKFYSKETNNLIADYRDGIINVYDRSIMSNELIPNSCYKFKDATGKKCLYNVDDLGRIYSVEAKNITPDEIVSEIINRTGNNDFGPNWDKALRSIKQSSSNNDVNIKCIFSYADDNEVAPKYARVNADVKGKTIVSTSLENKAKRIGNLFSAEENIAVIKKFSSKLQLSPEKCQRLLSEMNVDNGLAILIHENPEFNIERWMRTRNSVDPYLIVRSPKGKMPQNASVYAGNVYFFSPHLNSGLQARLRRGNGFVDLRGMSKLSYDDLVKLDKLYPDGVPFTKQGFPDFSNVAAKGRDGKPIRVDIGALTGDSKKDINMAETTFQNMGYSWEEGFTWHHIENTTMLLRVPTIIHQLVDHSGGMSMSGLKQ